jgi:tRNA uridine 5-carboxymethylaminomethyl modification enzyme
MYENVPGLSIELQQKLNKFRPSSIAQATLIQGMTPAAISLLIFKIRECENCNQ